jgi:predicted nucleic acid-binding protein
MSVLVDTSVWVEYFRKRPRLARQQLDRLDDLICEDLVAIVQPVQAEVLSGRIKKEREPEIRAAFGALRSLDLDWNAPATWDAVARCAVHAREAGVPCAGLVDRMVLLAAEHGGAALWTLDGPLLKLAQSRNAALFRG